MKGKGFTKLHNQDAIDTDDAKENFAKMKKENEKLLQEELGDAEETHPDAPSLEGESSLKSWQDRVCGKKIVNPTFSKHPRFLFVPEEDAYYTNGYGIYFDRDHSNKTTLFEDSMHEMSKEENILVVQKILNSIVMDYYVSNTSVSIQGGFPCYQKNFIEKFTIPNFTKEELNILNSLSDKMEIDEFLIDKYQLNIPVPNLLS